MLNEDFVNKYTTQATASNDALGLIDKGVGFTAAAVTDFATSLWNSVVVGVPKLLGVNNDEYRVETTDVLSSINEDWTNIYREHEGSVQTASFIGGLLAPGGVALKGMKLLQAGKVGFYPAALTDIAQTQRLSRLTGLMEAGGQATTQFRNLRWQILGANLAQETLQMAGMEVALLSVFNEHPFYEDYFKDPVKNFGIALAGGAILGSGFGLQLGLRKQMSEALGPIASDAWKTLQETKIDVPTGITFADQAQRLRTNAGLLRQRMEYGLQNRYTTDIFEQMALKWEGEAADLEKMIFQPELAAASTEVKMAARAVIDSDAAAGANTINLATFREADLTDANAGISWFARKPGVLKGVIDDVPAFFKAADSLKTAFSQATTLALKKYVPEWNELMTKKLDVYYSPHFKGWIPPSEIKQHIRAVDTGQTSYKTINVIKPYDDAMAEVLNRQMSTAFSDRKWIDALGSTGNVERQATVYVHPDDLPVINGWISRASEDAALGRPPTKFFLTNSTEGGVAGWKKGATEVSLEDLATHLSNKKEELAKSLIAEGASLQEISIRLNVKPEALEKHLLEGSPLMQQEGWRLYSSAELIDGLYLSKESQTLKLTTNGRALATMKYRNADMSAKLDSKVITAANTEIMQDITSTSKSVVARELHKSLDADKDRWDLLRASLSNAVNEKSGNFFTTSADFATRNMGDVSAISSVMGQTYFGTMNTLAKTVLTDLSSTLRAHTETQVGLNELNRIFNARAGTSGYIEWNAAERKLYRYRDMGDGALVREELRAVDGTKLDISEGAAAVLDQISKVGIETRELANVIRRIKGFKEIKDEGLHIPTFNPIGKFISYVFDTSPYLADESQRVRLLMGNSPNELATLEKAWKEEHGWNPNKRLITKSQQQAYNDIQMRLDPMDMDHVDISKFHSGASASAVPVFDDTMVASLVENIHSRLMYYTRQYQEMYLHDVMASLDDMSAANKRMWEAQPTAAKQVGLHQGQDAARAVKNMILGNNQLDQYTTWKTANNWISAGVEMASKSVSDIISAFRKQVPDASVPLTKAEFTKFSKELEGAGLPMKVFGSFEDYLLFKNADSGKLLDRMNVRDIKEAWDDVKALEDLRTQALVRMHNIPHSSAEQLISVGNSVISLFALRLMETGQPFVNAISVPILAIPELLRKMPKTFLGNEVTAEGVNVALPFRMITDGIRWYHSDAAKPWIERWVKEGFGQSIVSEASKLHQTIYTQGKGVVGKVQNMVNAENGLLKLLSTSSDFMEKETRLWALSVGVQAARTAYPGISDAGADLFAKQFMNRVVGNYYSAQRPAMFQGTAGMALGLFQTYMLTWAQSLFRSIEEKNLTAIAAQMLTQSALFGTSSIPLYDIYAKTIASNFSDKHYDLTTGTYRALPNKLAEFVVYGLPASLGVGLYTRGDLQPRIPVVSQNNPLDSVATINVVRQFYGATAHTLSKVLEANGMVGKAQALLEGLSMQSLSRPIARIAEMMPMPDMEGGVRAVGAVSREGNTVATSAEVWSVPGVLSRLLSARATEEQVKREMDYMSSFHASIDFANRKKTTEALKTAIRSGTLDNEGVMDSLASEYLRTGSATGWRAAVNEAIATSAGGLSYKLSRRLKPDDPLMQMIDNNF